MRPPILLLAALLAASMFAPFQQAAALDAPRALSGRQLQLMLTGNTIIGMGDDGPFWMYYPDPRTLWGRSAAGDVDVGTWWVENDQYCRSWRRWYEGQTRCWRMRSHGEEVLLWYSLDGDREGRSVLRSGNAMGDLPQAGSAPSQLADAGTGLSSELEALVAHAGMAPGSQIGPASPGLSERDGSVMQDARRGGSRPPANPPASPNARSLKLPFPSEEEAGEPAKASGAAPSAAPGALAGLAGTRLGGFLDRLGVKTGGAPEGGAGNSGSGRDGSGSGGGSERSR
jgi:hypothetical protein